MPDPAISAPRPSRWRLVAERLVDGVFRPLVGGLSLLLALLMPADAYELLQRPGDYALGQGLDVTQPHWQGQYVGRNALLCVAAGLVLWLVIASYRQPRHGLLRVGCRLVVTLLVAKGVVGFYQWALTGFDH